MQIATPAPSPVPPQVIIVDRLVDTHLHLREVPFAQELIRLSIEGGADTALFMPNLRTELINAHLAVPYLKALRGYVPDGKKMTFIPTVYLTETTTPVDIRTCVEKGIADFKIYPRFRTTGSENGVRNYFRVVKTVKTAAAEIIKRFGIRIRIHVHPEHPIMYFSSRDAEYAFLPIADMFLQETEAAIIWEHGTDSDCIPVWRSFAESGRFYVTLTAHHIATDEDSVFGDVRAVCKPPIKRALDRELLVRFICDNHAWVMAGSDSAPHSSEKKHVSQGQCACGAFTAPFLLPLYAHALDELLAPGLNRNQEAFVNFISRNARGLYGLPDCTDPVRLVRDSYSIPARYFPLLGMSVEPFWAGMKIKYRIEELQEAE